MEKVEIGNCTLYRADCLDVLPLLAGVDAVVTDPPYGIADCWKGGFSDKHGWGKAGQGAEARNEWDAEAPPKEVFDLLRTIGKVQAFWGGNHFGLPPSRGWLVWNKPERNFTLAEGELCWTSRDMALRVFDYRRSDPDRTHPTQKPVAVMAWTMDRLKVEAGALVVDPYMGSGTTGIACIRTGRRFVGVERDAEHFATACKRIETELRQGDLFALAL